jgi:site-specific DNA-adenine methylase
MISIAGTLAAPFPYFGGKANACEQVWAAFGAVDNYVEAFAGSAAMLLGAPDSKRIATINDADGFVANFWRAIAPTQMPSRTMPTGRATRSICLPAIRGWCAKPEP